MFTGFWRHASQSSFARGFGIGIGESFGFQYGKGGVAEGFLGRKAAGGVMRHGLGNAIGLAFMAVDAYSAYRERGFSGAAGSVAQNSLIWGVTRGAWEVGKTVLSNPYLLGAAAIGAVGYSGYRLGEAGIAKVKRIRNLEMGSDIVDTFGTMATMRQRSLAAIQNSHVNGRLAMGGEASLMHVPYMR